MMASNRPKPPPIGDDNPPRRLDPERRPAVVPLREAARPGPRQEEPPVEEAVPVAEQVLSELIGLRQQPVDPMRDYVRDGTRQLRWVQAAIAHQASLLDTTQQQVLAEAVLGVRPLSPKLLDAHFEAAYGRPRTEREGRRP